MKPYYEDDAVIIYHGDCREVLPLVQADVVVTDPPYGIGVDATFRDDFEIGLWGIDNSPGVRMACFHSPRRVVEFAASLKTWRFERMLWMNKVAMMSAPWRAWNMNGEAIFIASRSRDGWPDPPHYGSDCYTAKPWGKNGHPCFKPPTVMVDLVAKLAGPDDVVLDPFMGSGSTLRAAKDLGLKAVGIEVEERFCEIAAKRMAQEVLPL